MKTVQENGPKVNALRLAKGAFKIKALAQVMAKNSGLD